MQNAKRGVIKRPFYYLYILFNLLSSCSSLIRNTSSMIQICISLARCLKNIVPVVLSQARAKTSAFLAYLPPNFRDTVSNSCSAFPPALPLLQEIKIGHTCFIRITFVIGGSLGLSDAVVKRADEKISFSNMTFPHQLMRVMLMEVLADTICGK